ncbi:MAG: hypothetical protein KDA80_07040 [Planctomycetaceae bacterium]|nr:hypothetical protein [Planctomycetaceae bacterium]
MSPRLPGKSGPNSVQKNSGTWMAMAIVLVLTTGFIGLVSVIMPAIGKMLLVVAALPAFIAIHYFTWGRWLVATVEVEERDFGGQISLSDDQRIGEGEVE